VDIGVSTLVAGLARWRVGGFRSKSLRLVGQVKEKTEAFSREQQPCTVALNSPGDEGNLKIGESIAAFLKCKADSGNS